MHVPQDLMWREILNNFWLLGGTKQGLSEGNTVLFYKCWAALFRWAYCTTVQPDHWQLHADAVGSSASGHHLILCQVWTLSRSSQQPEPCSWSSSCQLPYRDDTRTETCSDLYYCESGHRLGRSPISNPWFSILLWTFFETTPSGAFFIKQKRVWYSRRNGVAVMTDYPNPAE